MTLEGGTSEAKRIPCLGTAPPFPGEEKEEEKEGLIS